MWHLETWLSLINRASSGPWNPAHFWWTMQSQAGIVKRLQLIACMESDWCQHHCFPWKFTIFLKHAGESPAAPQSASGNVRTMSTYREESLMIPRMADASKCGTADSFYLSLLFHICWKKKSQWICITFTVRRSEQWSRFPQIKGIWNVVKDLK